MSDLMSGDASPAKAAETKPEEKWVHPLRDIIPEVIRSWGAWKLAWNSAERFDEMMGLLHSGFSLEIDSEIEKEERADRIIFYLSVADGFQAHKPIGRESTREFYLSNKSRELARKAWKTLCDNFFKDDASYCTREEREHLLFREEVRQKLLWFFDPDRENLSSGENYYEKIASDFIRFFIGRMWSSGVYHGSARSHFSDSSFLAYKARPQLIRLIVEDECLEFFSERTVVENIDADTLKLLEKMALEGVGSRWPAKFPVASLEDAIGFGSDLAEATLILKEKVSFRERQKLIEEARLVRDKAEARLRELSLPATE